MTLQQLAGRARYIAWTAIIGGGLLGAIGMQVLVRWLVPPRR